MEPDAPTRPFPPHDRIQTMSSLWTPGGEHPVDPIDPVDPEDASVEEAPAGQPSIDDPLPEGLTPDEMERAEAIAREMAAVQEQLAGTPAEIVVSNHLMGLFELAAIHLSQQPPNLAQAALAIDALGAVVDRLQGRLGESEATLRDALNQIRLTYVSVQQAVEASENDTGDDGDDAD